MGCDTCIKSDEIAYLNQEIQTLKKMRDKDREDIYSLRITCEEIKGDVKLLTKSVNNLCEVVKILQEDVEELKSRPYKRYDKYSFAAVSALIGLVIASIYAYLIK